MATLVTARNLKPSQTLINLALALQSAAKTAEDLKPVVEAMQAAVVAENSFFVSAENIAEGFDAGRILNWSDMDLASSEDWKIADAAYHEKLLAAQYSVGLGYCPLLMAQSAEREARLAFIDGTAELSDFPVQLARSATSPAAKKYLITSLAYVLQYAA